MPLRRVSSCVATELCRVAQSSRRRPRRVIAFVGRLDKDVTAEDLAEYLSAAGVPEPSCKKLSAKDGKIFKTSAFMVSCDAKYSTILYDDSIWPSGSEVREWIFYQKSGEAIQPQNVGS